ncbi:E3 ubiquitin-protein ligase BRE1-like 2-like protein [Drosera capensis]
MADEDAAGEPDKKRPHLDFVSLAMARNSIASPDNKSVDASVLQYENQLLVQQLERQKSELHELEAKIQELKERQSSYDDKLIAVNRLWNQLADDLVLLGIRAGGGQDALKMLDDEDRIRGSVPSCPAEDMFLCRLLRTSSIDNDDCMEDTSKTFVEEALAKRHSSTMQIMKFLQDIIEAQRAKAMSISEALRGTGSTAETVAQLHEAHHVIEEEANILRDVMTILQQKHQEYADAVQRYIQNHLVEQAEIKTLTGELEERMVELEESRRKFVNLRMQKSAASDVHSMVSGADNGNLSPNCDRAIGLKELKDSIEEVKIVAAERLAELEDAREYNSILLKQLEDLEEEVKDEKFVYSSRMYLLLNDELLHWKAEVERYKTLTSSLQADRSSLVRREKELELLVEGTNSSKKAVESAELRVKELEAELQNFTLEKNDLEIKLEEAIQDSGRKDIKDEFQVMTSALSKEMGMMETQLIRWKQIAEEALSLHKEAQRLRVFLDEKVTEAKGLEDKYALQMAEIKTLKELIERLQQDKLELQILVDMHGQENYDNRNLWEIQESERRAHSQADTLKLALSEHSLELRVKAAKEAEAACHLRLSTAEAEIAELRLKLDASERSVLEFREAIKIKDADAVAYISEIETVGQAYEDMQTQNQHLLQQMAERDDYNIKLVSESVKTKQAQSLLAAEKQALSKKLEQLNISLELSAMRISQSEEQMKVVLSEAMKSTEDDRHLAVSVETAKWELADAEKELKWQKSAISSSEKEYEQIQRKIEETQLKLENARSGRTKIEEELKEWNEKVTELIAESGEAAIQKLQEEIKDCKTILKCSVCFDRPKDVVIVKCFHLFCNQCIQRNLEIRHRKCPGCGTPFGQSDVRFVKI